MQPPPPFPVALLAESDEASLVLRHAEETLGRFAVPFVAPTLRGRGDLPRVVRELESAGAEVFVVGNASADPLSHAVARATVKPVLAVPVEGPRLPALEALRASTAGGPGGGAVASLAVGRAGAVNAALLAVSILANADGELRERLSRFRAEQTAKVLEDRLETEE
jgi:5-(carboxyamino)imidazole ribonucleotide mutase